MPLGPGPEVDQQSFFDSVADREITIAGYTGLIRDLVELCPVKDDPTRFTTEAKDAFAANAWVASGNEMPEQYAHLVKPRETDYRTSWTYFTLMMVLSVRWMHLAGEGLLTNDDSAWAKRMFHYALVVLVAFSGVISANAWLP